MLTSGLIAAGTLLHGDTFETSPPTERCHFGAGVVCRISGEVAIIPDILATAALDGGADGLVTNARDSQPPYVYPVRIHLSFQTIQSKPHH